MLPAPARNLVDIARIKARAADAGVTSVALTRNRLTLSPARLDDEARGRVGALGAVFLERKQELALPVGYGESVTATALGLLSAIYSPESQPASPGGNI